MSKKKLLLKLAKEKRNRQARTSFLAFMQAVWWKPWPFLVGLHTVIIANRIDQAIEDYLAGISTCLDLEVPFRHGKSDLVSRALVPYFLGRCKQVHPDVILSGYGDSLVKGFSKNAKEIISSLAYKEIFPGVKIAKGADTAAEWQIEDSTGLVTVAGLGGSLTGKGAGLLVVDDFCKNRAEARSEAFRRRQWEGFGDAFMRVAPVSITILCATSWHVDDVRGRLREKMGKDEDFPAFESLRFPAKKADGSFLFPERFPAEWYLKHYAMLGPAWASALLDCNALPDSGNRFNVEGVQEEDLSDYPEIHYRRSWDLASSKKERDKDSPDFTWGTLGAVTKDSNGIEHLWIKDCVAGQWEAPERDQHIINATEKDGKGVPVDVESFGPYKDAYTTLKKVLLGKRIVTRSQLPGDKSVKCQPLEPIFEMGNVHVPKGAPWLKEWKLHFQTFPLGVHDDACDSLAICYHACMKPKTGLVAIM